MARSNFDGESLACWKDRINDDSAFQMLLDSLDAISSAIEKAKAHGWIYYKQKEDYKNLSVQMTFCGPGGKRWKKSIRFKEVYEVRTNDPMGVDTKFWFFIAIYNLVRNNDGIRPFSIDWETGLDYRPCHARNPGPPRSAADIRKI